MTHFCPTIFLSDKMPDKLTFQRNSGMDFASKGWQRTWSCHQASGRGRASGVVDQKFASLIAAGPLSELLEPNHSRFAASRVLLNPKFEKEDAAE
jgi:hypothetical protein